MNPQQTTVAIYATHELAEAAVNELQRTGYDMKRLSIVGKDYQSNENVVGFYNTGNRMLKWGAQGAFWGGIWGLFLGSAFFVVPGVGPLILAGPFVASLVGALEGAAAVGVTGALGAAFASIGIPKNSIPLYETEVKAGKFVLIAHGTVDEAARAKNLLNLEQDDYKRGQKVGVDL